MQAAGRCMHVSPASTVSQGETRRHERDAFLVSANSRVPLTMLLLAGRLAG